MDEFASIEAREKYLCDLVKAHYRQMLWFIARTLHGYKKRAAEDLTQELFAEITRTVKSQNKPFNYPAPYLYAAARRSCARFMEEKDPDSLEQCMTTDSKRETEPIQLVRQATEKELIQEQFRHAEDDIDHLTGITRDVMRLVAKDLNVSEIAKKLGISEATVREHKAKGRKQLQKWRELS